MRLRDEVVTAEQCWGICAGLGLEIRWLAVLCVNAIGFGAIAIGYLEVDGATGLGIRHGRRHIHVAAVTGLNHNVIAAANVAALLVVRMIVNASVGKLADRGQEEG